MKLSPRRTSRPGFTLIELLAVVTIIIILAGIVVGSMGYVNDKQANSKARVQVDLLAAAIEEYKLDNGDYPAFGNSPASGEGRSSDLYRVLFLEGRQNGTKIYVPDLDDNNKQGWLMGSGATTKIVDPWGNEYRYRSFKDNSGSINSNTQNPDFDLWSVGKDGKTPNNPSGTLQESSGRDDIGNF